MKIANRIMGGACIGAASAVALFALFHGLDVDPTVSAVMASMGGALASFVMLDKIKPEK